MPVGTRYSRWCDQFRRGSQTHSATRCNWQLIRKASWYEERATVDVVGAHGCGADLHRLQTKRIGDVIKSADPATGLGGDDRAGVAAVLVGLMGVLESKQDYAPLTLCFFIQEEIGLQGSRNLVVSKLGKPAFALNFDGGNPRKLTIGTTGGEKLKINLFGIPAHAGLAPQDGANAMDSRPLAESAE